MWQLLLERKTFQASPSVLSGSAKTGLWPVVLPVNMSPCYNKCSRRWPSAILLCGEVAHRSGREAEHCTAKQQDAMYLDRCISLFKCTLFFGEHWRHCDGHVFWLLQCFLSFWFIYFLGAGLGLRIKRAVKRQTRRSVGCETVWSERGHSILYYRLYYI